MSLKTKLLLLVTLSVTASVGAVAWLIETRAHEAFRQVDGSARRVYEGTGLGLYLSKQLATMLGGHMKAESEFGIGPEADHPQDDPRRTCRTP